MSQATFNFDETEKVYTVTEITRSIKNLLHDEFGEVWVEGEVSRPTYHGSGHVYLTIKDEHAQLPAACFRNTASRLPFRIEHGIKVLAFGRISVYEPHGRYQLIINRLEPKGAGALQLAFEQLKKRLAEEGLFDEAKKKPLPLLPKTIGIVTSPTGAAVRDILNVLDRRFPNVRIIIHPVRVQGKGAAGEIAAAIKDFDQKEILSNTDVLIVGRGGGSIEDLWPFNEEIVARAIAACGAPVISAVGHEIDFTISDFVADMRAPTPSAAAELVLPELAEIEGSLKNNQRRLALALQNAVAGAKIAVLKIYRGYAFKNPLERVQAKAQAIDEISRRTGAALKNYISLRKERIGASAGKLETLSPLGVLARGYSVTFAADGEVLKDAGRAETGETITTRLARGKLVSRVTEVDKDGRET